MKLKVGRKKKPRKKGEGYGVAQEGREGGKEGREGGREGGRKNRYFFPYLSSLVRRASFLALWARINLKHTNKKIGENQWVLSSWPHFYSYTCV